MIMSMFTWVWDHGYRYDYNAMGVGTGTSLVCQEVTGTDPRPGRKGTSFRIRITMGTGMGKGILQV